MLFHANSRIPQKEMLRLQIIRILYGSFNFAKSLTAIHCTFCRGGIGKPGDSRIHTENIGILSGITVGGNCAADSIRDPVLFALQSFFHKSTPAFHG